jgi:hypothetical protein
LRRRDSYRDYRHQCRDKRGEIDQLGRPEH